MLRNRADAMTDKSHASVEQRVCPVCGNTHDVGVLLDRRLHNTLERTTVTGYDLCPEHKKLHEDGFIALVEATGGTDGMKVWEANRTGKIAHLRRMLLPRVFNTPIDPKLPMIFVEPGVIDKLLHMQEKV